MDTLFDLEVPRAFDRDAFRDRLRALAARNIWIGGSSWKYEGWLDQIYTRSRYQTRGRFSKKIFEETSLAEYASVFPAVCGDFSFYQFPNEAFWAKLFLQTPGNFRWGLKVPEQITAARWPVHPRYGALAGLANPTFLDAALFEQAFLRAIAPCREQIGVLIFEFGPTLHQNFRSPQEFVNALEPFLSRLPAGWRCAVEIRNAEFLSPFYFHCLRAHGIAHVYNAWARMPEIKDQIAIPGSRTSDMIVARALLKRGRPYEDAVKMFAPYNRIQEVNEPVRSALRELIDIATLDGDITFVFVNNRLEGNSPATIIAITE